MLCEACRSAIEGRFNGISAAGDGKTKYIVFEDSIRRGCIVCSKYLPDFFPGYDRPGDLSLEFTVNRLKRKDNSKTFAYELKFNIPDSWRFVTFLLNDVEAETSTQSPSPQNGVNNHTPSAQVLSLARSWIGRCRCTEFWSHPGPKFYPRRLVDLRPLKKLKALENAQNLRGLAQDAELTNVAIRIIEVDPVAMDHEENNRYITLSHCWGNPHNVMRLTTDTQGIFMRDGVPLRDLSNTFRDAIIFASLLDEVGYIWIDSLCIIQGGTGPEGMEISRKDWLEQSRLMGRIYAESYLNISATAAADGNSGLFLPQSHSRTWGEEIKVHTDTFRPLSSESRSKDSRSTFSRARLTDLSFWDETVEEAPVNRRAWVLQERVMSPRVLHFCDSGIAWECGETINAEEYPSGMAIENIEVGDIIPRVTVKSAMTRIYNEPEVVLFRGQKGQADWKHCDSLQLLSTWKHVVEIYSKAGLTMPRDKLIALSGIAGQMAEGFGCDYVAGMWRNDLEGQLLWKVNDEPYGSKVHASRTVPGMPSFSWASLYTPFGVTYGDTYGGRSQYSANHIQYFKVERCEILLTDEHNPFGLLKQGRLWLRAQYIRRIRIHKFRVWYFDGDTASGRSHNWVKLDAMSDKGIFGDDAASELYSVPAVWHSGTEIGTYTHMTCFIFKYLGQPSTGCREFQRIGLMGLRPDDGKVESAVKCFEQHEKNELICIV